ncbi:MAG: hypothetical protein SFY69_10420 [Planctomycetota bacterium]|nr:hypothetical protein [Planctomycetota bacterium]
MHRALLAGVVAGLCTHAHAQLCTSNALGYADFSLSAGDLSYSQNSTVDGTRLVLAPSQPGTGGSSFYRLAKHTITGPWMTRFTFRIIGGGDGMAFVIQDESPTSLGSLGSGLGYSGIERSLAVEIDTFSFTGEFAEDHLSVQTGFGGPTFSDDASSIAHAVLPFDVNDGVEREAIVAYDGTTLRIWIDGQATLSVPVSFDLIAPDGCAYVGFTSGNGGSFGEHSVSSWSFTVDGPLYPTFDGATGITTVGNAALAGDVLELTQAVSGQRGAGWYDVVPVTITSPWVSDFVFTLDGEADGFAFVVQNESTIALGGGGSGLGYADNGPQGITASLAVEFDTFAFTGEFPADHVSIQTNFAGPNNAGDNFSLAHGVLAADINDSQPHHAMVVYDGAVLRVYVDGALLAEAPVDFSQGIAGPGGIAFVGFTGGTGAVAATQAIRSWNFGSAPDCLSPDIGEFVFDQTVNAGDAVTFTFVPVGSAPFTYSWFLEGQLVQDGGPISGATTNSLTIDPVGPEHAGQWDYVVDNDCGNVGSGFVLTVEGGVGCDPDFNQDGNVDQDDIACLAQVVAGDPFCSASDPDFNRDGNVDQDDINSLEQVVAGQPCP